MTLADSVMDLQPLEQEMDGLIGELSNPEISELAPEYRKAMLETQDYDSRLNGIRGKIEAEWQRLLLERRDVNTEDKDIAPEEREERERQLFVEALKLLPLAHKLTLAANQLAQLRVRATPSTLGSVVNGLRALEEGNFAQALNQMANAGDVRMVVAEAQNQREIQAEILLDKATAEKKTLAKRAATEDLIKARQRIRENFLQRAYRIGTEAQRERTRHFFEEKEPQNWKWVSITAAVLLLGGFSLWVIIATIAGPGSSENKVGSTATNQALVATKGETETPEAKGTSEAEGTPEATEEAEGTPEATEEAEGTPEATEEAEGTPEATEEAEGTPEATTEAEGTPEATEEAEGTPEATEEAEGTPEATEEAEGTPEAKATKAPAKETSVPTPKPLLSITEITPTEAFGGNLPFSFAVKGEQLETLKSAELVATTGLTVPLQLEKEGNASLKLIVPAGAKLAEGTATYKVRFLASPPLASDVVDKLPSLTLRDYLESKVVRGVRIRYDYTNRIVLNEGLAQTQMRADPDVKSARQKALRNGEQVEILRNDVAGWYKLRIQSSEQKERIGAVGWIERWMVDDEGVPPPPKKR